MSRAVLATVWCGHCAAEKRHAELIGEVVRYGERINWMGRNQRGLRYRRKQDPSFPANARNMTTLSWPAYRIAPAEIEVYCPRHGPDRVSGAVLLSARGRVIATYLASA